MSLIYAAEPNALMARDRAFSLEEARQAAGGEPGAKLKWMLTAVDDAYAPYLVKIHSLADDRAMVSFVDCQTGEVLDEQVEIDLTDRELVWNRLPSTLEGWNSGTTDCAFLFLSSKIHERSSQAQLSGGGTGKWPRAAAVTAGLSQVRIHVRELVEQDADVRRRLSAHERRLLVDILAKLDA